VRSREEGMIFNTAAMNLVPADARFNPQAYRFENGQIEPLVRFAKTRISQLGPSCWCQNQIVVAGLRPTIGGC